MDWERIEANWAHCKVLARQRWSRITLLGAWLALGASGAAAQLPAPPRPDVLMSTLTSDVFATLQRDRAAGRTTDLARMVEERIVPMFDFARMTRIALGRNWRLASAEQQSALVAQFQTLLVRTYSQALVEFRDQTIEYRPLRAAVGETEVTVRSALRGGAGAEPLTIDYEMADGESGWKVYDVKLAGVSVVLTYRESFASIVRASGVDGLIKALEAKNRQPDARTGAADASKLAPVLLIYGSPRTANP